MLPRASPISNAIPRPSGDSSDDRAGQKGNGMTKRAGTRALALLAACGALLGLPGVAAAAGPTAETLAADKSLTLDTYALLSGTLNPNGFNVVYRFQWGRTTKYGNTTAVTSAGNGKADVPVDISLDALKPSTTYHFRLVVSPAKSTGEYGYLPDIFGADKTLRTTRALGLSFASSKARVAKGKAKVKVKAVGPPDDTAGGSLKLKRKGKAAVLGSIGYSVDVGNRKTLKVKLTRAGRRALAAAGGRLKVVASAKTRGTKKAATKTITLEA